MAAVWLPLLACAERFGNRAPGTLPSKETGKAQQGGYMMGATE